MYGICLGNYLLFPLPLYNKLLLNFTIKISHNSPLKKCSFRFALSFFFLFVFVECISDFHNIFVSLHLVFRHLTFICIFVRIKLEKF